MLSLLAVEALSPPAVPNACEELVERQQSRSAAGEEAAWRLSWGRVSRTGAVQAGVVQREGSEVGDAAAAAEEAQCRCPSCSAACSRALLSSGDSADSGRTLSCSPLHHCSRRGCA